MSANIIILISMWILSWWVSTISTQSSFTSSAASLKEARALDSLLQDYAFQAMAHTDIPRTGDIYNGAVPSNLTGIKVSAMRLRSGSLRTRGVSMYHEFEIPKGVIEQPYLERLIFVYQNLGNWSTTYYPLPHPLALESYTYLAPVLGLLAYDASDLNARNLPELTIQASDRPISIHFSGLELRPVPDGSVPKCVLVNLNGTINLSNVLSDNICTTFQQGHFSIVVESMAPAPAPAPSITPSSPSESGGKNRSNKNNTSSKVWIIVGSVVGGIALLGVIGILAVWVSKLKEGKKMDHMERAADVGVALHMTSVGSTKAPVATGTRTQPNLETEYVP